jgi:hypothetical protein
VREWPIGEGSGAAYLSPLLIEFETARLTTSRNLKKQITINPQSAIRNPQSMVSGYRNEFPRIAQSAKFES